MCSFPTPSYPVGGGAVVQCKRLCAFMVFQEYGRHRRIHLPLLSACPVGQAKFYMWKTDFLLRRSLVDKTLKTKVFMRYIWLKRLLKRWKSWQAGPRWPMVGLQLPFLREIIIKKNLLLVLYIIALILRTRTIKTLCKHHHCLVPSFFMLQNGNPSYEALFSQAHVYSSSICVP